MNFSFKNILLSIVFQFIFRSASFEQPLRIMPMGNSITFDSNSQDVTNPRPDGQRISYRYKLYQLITSAGYSFDFTGSENAGNNYFQDTEMDDNAGFPGINDAQLAYLINTGYNQRIGQYESPGPYLNYYPADIILLHIGTNDLDENPNDVKNILDRIRNYDSQVIVLVARIINRATYSSLTTTFNNNVEAMVIARHDPGIIMVNMETGAGINYSTDMADNLHPNSTGYNKMAAKWFETIDNLNAKPILTSIPQQTIIQGSSFNTINLDDFVTDDKDPDNLIQWTLRLQANSKYTAYIDGNRLLHVSVNDVNWFGSEVITLKAIDSGSGAFRKNDSTQVTYEVTKSNEPPVITSIPVLNVFEDNNYNYPVVAVDSDNNTLTYSALQIPAWLSFSASTHVLSGRPGNSEVGVYDIALRVSDGTYSVDQEFQLTVKNVNDLPVITSVPVNTGRVGEYYQYEIIATDVDVGDVLTVDFSFKPAWLSTNQNGNIIFGIPAECDLGANSVILKVSDGHANILQGFTISVSGPTSLNENEKNGILIYPNPAQNTVYLRVTEPAQIRLVIYDISGRVMSESKADHAGILVTDISKLINGIYFFRTFINDRVLTGKLVIEKSN